MKLPRRNFLHLAAGAAALPSFSRMARAQTYPTRAVRLIVPFAPAGTTDIAARLMGQWLSERLGQQFVIENRPGASTTIGTEAVVRALPAGDPLLPDVEVVLQSTGVLAGAFGFVEAYTKKKQEMAGWLTDPDAHVRVFAESYVRLLDRRIAAEQRRAEESLEMRKRMYDDPDDSGENQT